VNETAADLVRLQRLLDESYETAGDHLRSIITPERRVAAEDLVERLNGMCLLVLATVSADGRPFAAPVDSIFHRGSFYLGSSPDSLRFRHIRGNPAVSATHVPSEAFSVSVHGRAALVDVGSSGEADVRQALIDVYVPLYGTGWEGFLDSGVAYARIDAERMFTFSMPVG
jgi:nitroimidazol reductase NimA-like FMN-containing flavoprotein (pyridoxamine 5'-phosphate oxidase superfamily)